MIRAIGTLAGIMGAFLVASGIYLVGYILFSISAFLWIIAALKYRDHCLILLNAVYLTANGLGLYNALFI